MMCICDFVLHMPLSVYKKHCLDNYANQCYFLKPRLYCFYFFALFSDNLNSHSSKRGLNCFLPAANICIDNIYKLNIFAYLTEIIKKSTKSKATKNSIA